MSATLVAHWVSLSARKITDSPEKFRKQRRRRVYPLIEWTSKRIIAFPVHSPGHWTLGIVINYSWRTEQKADWRAFHLDSYPCNQEAIKTAHKIALFVTGIKHRYELSIKEIPVPGQRTSSNDCGLWPAHYLRVFLKEREAFINRFQSVCSPEFRS